MSREFYLSSQSSDSAQSGQFWNIRESSSSSNASFSQTVPRFPGPKPTGFYDDDDNNDNGGDDDDFGFYVPDANVPVEYTDITAQGVLSPPSSLPSAESAFSLSPELQEDLQLAREYLGVFDPVAFRASVVQASVQQGTLPAYAPGTTAYLGWTSDDMAQPAKVDSLAKAYRERARNPKDLNRWWTKLRVNQEFDRRKALPKQEFSRTAPLPIPDNVPLVLSAVQSANNAAGAPAGFEIKARRYIARALPTSPPLKEIQTGAVVSDEVYRDRVTAWVPVRLQARQFCAHCALFLNEDVDAVKCNQCDVLYCSEDCRDLDIEVHSSLSAECFGERSGVTLAVFNALENSLSESAHATHIIASYWAADIDPLVKKTIYKPPQPEAKHYKAAEKTFRLEMSKIRRFIRLVARVAAVLSPQELSRMASNFSGMAASGRAWCVIVGSAAFHIASVRMATEAAPPPPQLTRAMPRLNHFIHAAAVCRQNSLSLVQYAATEGTATPPKPVEVGIGLWTRVFPFHNHDCDPNLTCVLDYMQFNLPSLQGRALRDIQAGEPVTIEYIDAARGDVFDRKSELFWSYDFDCQCAKCTRDVKDFVSNNKK